MLRCYSRIALNIYNTNFLLLSGKPKIRDLFSSKRKFTCIEEALGNHPTGYLILERVRQFFFADMTFE